MAYSRDRALICESGHVVNEYSTLDSFRNLNPDFCATCGARNIGGCPSCSAPIPGGTTWTEDYGSTHSTKDKPFVKPDHCVKCGAQFPWTQATIAAGLELADELDDLSDEDRDKLKRSFEEIARDTPQAEVAATRIKKIMAKVGGEGAKSIGRIAQQLVTQAAKDALFGPGT